MQSMIIIGSSQAQTEYIANLASSLSVPSYGITKIEGVIKIQDIHHVIRASKVYTAKKEKRLTILSGSLTIPAQNALLKYLEELPESDYVVFLVNSVDLLLETIRSRSSVKVLGTRSIDTREERISNALLSGDIKKNIFEIGQRITSAEQYEAFLWELRSYILTLIVEHGEQAPETHIHFLKYLHDQYQYVQENNLNPRFALESFLSP